MKRSVCGLADLIELLQAGRSDLLPSMAKLIGYEHKEPTPQVGFLSAELPDIGGVGLSVNEKTTKNGVQETLPLASVPFWCVYKYDSVRSSHPERQTADYEIAPVDPQPKAHWPDDLPAYTPLSQWRDLVPRLRCNVSEQKSGRAIDRNAIVKRLSRAQLLNTIPRKTRRCWGQQAQIIVDKSRRLTPYWWDQQQLCRQLLEVFPRGALSFGRYWDGMDAPTLSRDGGGKAYPFPPPGTLVLVLSDLGCLSSHGESKKFWISFGQKLLDHDCRPVAMLPCASACTDKQMHRTWTICAWEQSASTAVLGRRELETQAHALLALISPAIRIEPGLLRAMRRNILQANACVEALAWQHPAIASGSSEAATLDQDAAVQLRKDFARAPTKKEQEQRRRALKVIRDWRRALPREIWFEEICNLTPELQSLLPDHQDMKDARLFFRALGSRIDRKQGLQGVVPWFRRVMGRINSATWRDADIQADLHRLWWLTEKDNPTAIPPPGFDPASIPYKKEQQTRTIEVSQTGKHLVISVIGKQLGQSLRSPIYQLRTRNGKLKIGPDDGPPALDGNRFWKSGKPPRWASDWGVDPYGKWVEFAVPGKKIEGPVTQRIRWIEPGTFVMGSPEDEAGRWDDEGPWHEVTLTRGYWLFDTPVTQALYETVIGDNPSRFKTAQRPVEQVSWRDAQAFIQRLNETIPDLHLSLPTEAQWEYACRAGTPAMNYSGAMEIRELHYARMLDEIAWYGGDSTEIPYLHKQGGTSIVAEKKANPWGLYDMLGNVWEWCEDGQREYTKASEIDPLGPQESGSARVLRGGSSNSETRYVRSAFRSAYHPTLRDYLTGFRCARVHEPGLNQGAEPAETPQGRVAEQRSAAFRPGAARLVDCSKVFEVESIDWPKLERFVIHSDREKIHIQQFSKPEWAHAIGRDHYGLWASFKIELQKDAAIIQKMRWIAPGRFLMGSPEDEAGHSDDEDPRHDVTLTRGYWLFDTPVTQALYETVTGDNPSRFRSAQRPVEQVSWQDAQAFIHRVNEKIPELHLSLPTEAQWEYACRAGTPAATYAGTMKVLGLHNAPVLDGIAWYGGNSGVEFDIKEGHDSSGWKGKQYKHERAGTRIVAQKKANPWGLYDMLGNVWEWCADGQRQYRKASEIDPLGPQEGGAHRVLRGGSWLIVARCVRSAYRDASHRDGADSRTGFRCARVHPPAAGSELRRRP